MQGSSAQRGSNPCEAINMHVNTVGRSELSCGVECRGPDGQYGTSHGCHVFWKTRGGYMPPSVGGWFDSCKDVTGYVRAAGTTVQGHGAIGTSSA